MAELLNPETLASLRALAAESDPGLLKTLGSTFIEDAEKRFGEIKKALAAGDSTRVVQEAHTLKSSSAGLGATGLSALFKELELQGKAGKPSSELSPVFARIEAEWPAVKAALQRECGL